MTYTLRGRMNLRATLDDGAGQRVVVGTRDVFPNLNLALSSAGVENWQQYYRSDVFAAAGSATVNLNDSANTITVLGSPLRLDKVKFFALAIASPDGIKKVKFGPLNASNPAPLWFGGTTATYFEEVFDYVIRPNRYGYWSTTDGTACNVKITNHSAVSVTTHLWVAGYR